jgi:DNA-3-methyladenine glycosylase II
MDGTLQRGSTTESLGALPLPEQLLSTSDPMLARVIATQPDRWPSVPTEDPIWGLLRIVMAQQISTQAACRLAERVKNAFPMLAKRSPEMLVPDLPALRAVGLTSRRAQCCIDIVQKSESILAKVREGHSWEDALAGTKGIGSWTISVFRIMVLRDPDELPARDIGLQRATVKIYGRNKSLEHLSQKWRPFRSVACWYLWRTLGNKQLG